ncbi:immunoglobulin-like domain-containing receptor 1 isoform X1 [Huso huso]
MRKLILAGFLLGCLSTGCVSILVIVPETERYTSLFATVRLRCDYSTSSNLQDVLVTWRYKSFCKDPILDYYSAGYQASLQLGQDPANDCSDSMREVRVVIQKRGGNEPVLGMEYRQRKITIQDKADLVISEVMWWDHGVYFCSIEASGDTTGDSDKEIKLVVYNWLVVIFIILGILLLILLLGVCWCQCCPHRCCCYVRCACCPTRCCCPEKAMMRYKMIKEAQKALMPWAVGQPIYAPVGSGSSAYHSNPQLRDYAFKQNIPMMPLPPPTVQHPANNSVLDYIENQMRTLDSNHPLQQLPPPPHRGANNIQFRGGPPSILSSLNDIEVREIDRRVIHLPPIVEGLSRDNSSQGNRGYYSGSDRGARGPRNQGGSRSSQDSSLLNRQQPPDARRRRDDVQSNRRSPRRDFSPSRREDLRSYSDESEYDGHRRPAAGRRGRGDTGGSGGSRYAGRQRSRSRDDLSNEPRRPQGRKRSFSPPGRRSWSSDEDLSRRGGNGRSRNRDREGDWPEKPPSYSSVDIMQGRANNRAHRNNEVYSERSSRSGRSMVI